MKRRRIRFVWTATWFLGFQTTRQGVTPWRWETLICLIPGLGIGVCWGWHCEDCRERAKGWLPL